MGTSRKKYKITAVYWVFLHSSDCQWPPSSLQFSSVQRMWQVLVIVLYCTAQGSCEFGKAYLTLSQIIVQLPLPWDLLKAPPVLLSECAVTVSGGRNKGGGISALENSVKCMPTLSMSVESRGSAHLQRIKIISMSMSGCPPHNLFEGMTLRIGSMS